MDRYMIEIGTRQGHWTVDIDMDNQKTGAGAFYTSCRNIIYIYLFMKIFLYIFIYNLYYIHIYIYIYIIHIFNSDLRSVCKI